MPSAKDKSKVLKNSAPKSSKLMIIFITVAAVIVILGVIFLFFHHARDKNGNFSNRFPLTDSQINDVTSFFASNPSAGQINSYCSENRISCFYYCRQVSPENGYCKNITGYSRGNYTGNPRGYNGTRYQNSGGVQ